MPDFSFVHDDGFRLSLEADFAELESALNVGAWKAVHVLSGSIVEAVLADRLVAIQYTSSSKPILELELASLIDICKTQKLISQDTASLLHIIRGYRNLIHPGRIIRLQQTVDMDSATVAKSLVNIVLRDILSEHRATQGLSAEQVVTQIRSDPSRLRILGYLLKNVRSSELERLLLITIPCEYVASVTDFVPDSRFEDALRECFRISYGLATEVIKRRVAEHFVSVVSEREEAFVRQYEQAFFIPSQLIYLTGDDAKMVKQHLFPLIEESQNTAVKRTVGGLSRFVEADEVYAFGIPLVQAFLNAIRCVDESEYFIDDELKGFVYAEYYGLSDVSRIQFDDLLKRWTSIIGGAWYQQSALRELESYLKGNDLPF